MSGNKRTLESVLIQKREDSSNDLFNSQQVEDQLRVDDDVLTIGLPGRQSNRNRVIYNSASKATLPGRFSSRNRTIFKKNCRFS